MLVGQNMRYLLIVLFSYLLACLVPKAIATPQRLLVPEARELWGGDAVCPSVGPCRVLAVAHRDNALLVFEIEERRAHWVGRVATAHHPDGGKWLDDTRFVAAIEFDQGARFGRVTSQGVELAERIAVGFAPIHVETGALCGSDTTDLLLSPYHGNEMAIVCQSEQGWREPQRLVSCTSPWYPIVARSGTAPVILAGCRDDQTLARWDRDASGSWQWRALAQFDQVPRQVALSADGRRLYVALEMGQRIVVVDWQEEPVRIHQIPVPEIGNIAVAVFRDDTVAWADHRRLSLRRCQWEVRQCQTQELPLTGEPMRLRVIDLDRDGHEDLIAFSTNGGTMEIWFGPLWQENLTGDRP